MCCVPCVNFYYSIRRTISSLFQVQCMCMYIASDQIDIQLIPFTTYYWNSLKILMSLWYFYESIDCLIPCESVKYQFDINVIIFTILCLIDKIYFTEVRNEYNFKSLVSVDIDAFIKYQRNIIKVLNVLRSLKYRYKGIKRLTK